MACIIPAMRNNSSSAPEGNIRSPAWARKMQRGIGYAQRGNTKRAAEQFQAVIKMDPKNPDALHFLGIIMHQRGRSDEAIRLICHSLAFAPDNANAHNNLGNVLNETGESEEAIASYRTALKHDPQNAESLNNLGVLLRNRGEFDEAIEVLSQAVEIQPTLAEAHHNLGQAYASKGQLFAASESYLKEFDLSGDWADPVRVAQIFVARVDLAEAERLLVDYLERHPEHSGAQFQLSAVRRDNVEFANEGFVTEQFDRFAASFDATLKRLDYRAPELVAGAVAERLGEPKADKDILDLGCGTGLAGLLLTSYKKHLVGVDLSTKMMELARQRGCYDALSKAELQSYMEKQPPAHVDIAICVDTLVYIGALERTYMGAAHILKPGGLFIATVEALPDEADDDYVVDPVGRFKHARHYLQRLATENGLTALSIGDAVLRQENKVDVNGFVVQLQKPPPVSPQS